MDDGDKAECKEIAREIVKEVLIEHVKCCPHGLALIKSKMLLLGACIGSGFGGAGGMYGIIQLLNAGS